MKNKKIQSYCFVTKMVDSLYKKAGYETYDGGAYEKEGLKKARGQAVSQGIQMGGQIAQGLAGAYKDLAQIENRGIADNSIAISKANIGADWSNINSTTGLLNAYNSISRGSTPTYKQLLSKPWKATLKGAMHSSEGAATGAQMGGWVGAIIGGVAGTGASLAGRLTARKNAKKLANQAKIYNDIANIRIAQEMKGASNRIQNNLITGERRRMVANGGSLFNDGGAIDYAFNQQYLNNGFLKATNNNSTMKPIYSLGGTSDNILLNNTYANGGTLLSNGAQFTDGVSHVNTGESHELNPYDGVPMGTDREGTPNFVEEGEVIYNDYVFSARLKVPKIPKDHLRHKEKMTYEEKALRKYQDMTFADAAKKIEKSIYGEGGNLNGKQEIQYTGEKDKQDTLTAMLGVLAQVQEQIKQEEEIKKLQEAIANMSPEELQALQEQMIAAQQQEVQQQQAAEQQAIQEQQMAQQGISPEEQAAMQQQQISPEEQMAVEQQAVPQEPQMTPEEAAAIEAQQGQYANGGNLLGEGGDPESPTVGIKDIQNYIKKYGAGKYWTSDDITYLVNNLYSTGWDPAGLLYAMATESRFNPRAKNPASTARGLAQILEGTAKTIFPKNYKNIIAAYDSGNRTTREAIDDAIAYYKWAANRITTDRDNMRYGRLKVNLLSPNSSFDAEVSKAVKKDSLTEAQKKYVQDFEQYHNKPITYRDLAAMYDAEMSFGGETPTFSPPVNVGKVVAEKESLALPTDAIAVPDMGAKSVKMMQPRTIEVPDNKGNLVEVEKHSAPVYNVVQKLKDSDHNKQVLAALNPQNQPVEVAPWLNNNYSFGGKLDKNILAAAGSLQEPSTQQRPQKLQHSQEITEEEFNKELNKLSKKLERLYKQKLGFGLKVLNQEAKRQFQEDLEAVQTDPSLLESDSDKVLHITKFNTSSRKNIKKLKDFNTQATKEVTAYDADQQARALGSNILNQLNFAQRNYLAKALKGYNADNYSVDDETTNAALNQFILDSYNKNYRDNILTAIKDYTALTDRTSKPEWQSTTKQVFDRKAFEETVLNNLPKSERGNQETTTKPWVDQPSRYGFKTMEEYENSPLFTNWTSAVLNSQNPDVPEDIKSAYLDYLKAVNTNRLGAAKAPSMFKEDGNTLVDNWKDIFQMMRGIDVGNTSGSHEGGNYHISYDPSQFIKDVPENNRVAYGYYGGEDGNKFIEIETPIDLNNPFLTITDLDPEVTEEGTIQRKLVTPAKVNASNQEQPQQPQQAKVQQQQSGYPKPGPDYAGAVASIAGILGGIGGPGYENTNPIIAEGYRRNLVGPERVQRPLAPKYVDPFQIRTDQNQLFATTLNANRNSGLNPSSLAAANIAAGHKAQAATAEALRAGILTNDELYNKYYQQDLAAMERNQQAQLQADMANQRDALERARYIESGYKMREDIDKAYAGVLNAGFQNLANYAYRNRNDKFNQALTDWYLANSDLPYRGTYGG